MKKVISAIELIHLIQTGWYITRVSNSLDTYRITLRNPNAFFEMVINITEKEFLFLINASLLSVDDETYQDIKTTALNLRR